MGPKAALTAIGITIALVACADPVIESTTVLEDTADTRGPYEVAAVTLGKGDRDRLELHYVTDAADANVGVVILRAVDDDGDQPGELHIGGIPGQPTGTEIRYYVDIKRGTDVLARDPEGDGEFVFVITP